MSQVLQFAILGLGPGRPTWASRHRVSSAGRGRRRTGERPDGPGVSEVAAPVLEGRKLSVGYGWVPGQTGSGAWTCSRSLLTGCESRPATSPAASSRCWRSALSRNPKVLLADDLSLGLAPMVVDRLLDAVRRAARERGVAVLLVEQHVAEVLRYADRVYVMRRGRVEISGEPAELADRLSDVEDSYLGRTSPAGPGQ